MQDVAALESMPLLGFVVTVDSSQSSQFKLYHQDKLYYIFKAENTELANRYKRDTQHLVLHIVTILILIFAFLFNRWIESFKQAAVL